MSDTSALDGSNPVQNSCWNKIIESKWTDAALITGLVALLVIGILASTGIFNFMGTTNAAYLSYGMYGGAALLLIAEIVKRAIICCSKGTSADEIDKGSSVPFKFTNPLTKRSEPLSPETIQNLKEQAATYASTNAQSTPWATKEQAAEQLKNYIIN